MTYRNRNFTSFDLLWEWSKNRVEFQQVGAGFQRRDIVNANDLYIRRCSS